MELVEKQLGSGVEWVVIGARGTQSNARSLDCAESFARDDDGGEWDFCLRGSLREVVVAVAGESDEVGGGFAGGIFAES